MRSVVTSGIIGLFGLVFCACVPVSLGRELQIPDQPPGPSELAGRWLEKTTEHHGDATRYCLYVYSRKSEFFAFYLDFDARKKTWTEAGKILKGGDVHWEGYVQSSGPDSLVLNAMPHALFPVVLPMKVKYHLAGGRLTLSPSLGAPKPNTSGTLKRVARFPGRIELANANESANFDRRIAEGLFDDAFRKWFLMGMREASGHASDDEMVRNFREHRGDFEKLLAMILEDKDVKPFRYDEDAAENKAPADLSPERFEQYRTLFHELDLQRGVSGFGDGKEISFNQSSRGMLNSGSSKSYVWRKEAPPAEQIVENIDDYVEKIHAKNRTYSDQHGHGAPNEYLPSTVPSTETGG